MIRIVLAAIFFILALLFISVGVDKIGEWKKDKYHDPKAKVKLIQGIVLIVLAVTHTFIILPIIFR